MKNFKQHLNEQDDNKTRPDPRVIQSQSFAPPTGDNEWQNTYILGAEISGVWGTIITDNIYERKLVQELKARYGKFIDEPISDLDDVIRIVFAKADEFEGFGGHSQLLKYVNQFLDEFDKMEEILISVWRQGGYTDWETSLRMNALDRLRQRITSGIVDVLQPKEL